MERDRRHLASSPALERLLEDENLGIETFHPGELAITRELAERCTIQSGAAVLDIAAGRGESACFLAETFGAHVVGIDYSEQMIRRASEKAALRGLPVQFCRADAHDLPLSNDTFDVVISEGALCLLQKSRVLQEMKRVAKPGGYVGIHNLSWREDTPAKIQREMREIEQVQPETIADLRQLFTKAGLIEVNTVDKSEVAPQWMKGARKTLGIVGQGKIACKSLRRWGIASIPTILKAERLYASKYLGCAIVIGRKAISQKERSKANGGIIGSLRA